MGRDEGVADDAELVLEARRGDAGAFETLVRRHYRAAFAVARARVESAMDAEDVVQDAFVRALERLDECDPERFAGWLLAIVRNHAHNVRAYEARRRGEDPESPNLQGAAAVGSAGEGRAERSELRATLEAALDTLSPIQREVLLLHDLEGLGHAEIGEIVSVSTGMSRYHLMQARRAMREALGDRTEAHGHGG